MKTHAILGTDLSACSDKLIECANAYRNLGISKITLVHALGIKHIQAFEDLLRKGVDDKLESQREKLEEQGFEVDSKVMMGLAKDELQKLAKDIEADLIIIGTHGISLTKALIGSTASEIIHNVMQPLLLMVMKPIESKDGIECEIFCRDFAGHILLPTDFSDSSEVAFQWLRTREVNLPKLTLMHIQDEVKIGKHLIDRLDEFNRIDNERLERLKKSFNDKHPETEIKIVLQYGSPIQLILKYIEEYKIYITVMGSQGRGYIPETYLGSVSHQVARHADSSLLFIPLPKH